MPVYFDHLEKASGANVTSLTVPYVFAPEALNRALLVIAMTCHPTDYLNYPFSSTTYAGTVSDLMNVGQSVTEAGVPIARCASFFTPRISGAEPEPPASGNVVVNLNRAQNMIVFVLGLRGVEWPFYEDKLGKNGGLGPLAINNLTPNDYVALAGFAANSSPVVIDSIDPASVVAIGNESVGPVGLGSVSGVVLRLPSPVTTATAFTGNYEWGGIGWSSFADLGTGEPPPPPPPTQAERDPLSPYFKHEIRARAGVVIP